MNLIFAVNEKIKGGGVSTEWIACRLRRPARRADAMPQGRVCPADSLPPAGRARPPIMMRIIEISKKGFLWFIITSLFLYVLVTPLFAYGKIVTDRITSPSLVGNKLGDSATRNITIYLPPEYDSSDERYSVIYLLHGYGGDERSYIDALGERLAVSFLDSLINTRTMEPLIIVMPDAKNSYGGSFYTNSSLIGNYEDYIVYDLVNYIDSNYRTIACRDGRAIAGGSMGGYGAMKLAIKHSDLFCAVASLCAPIDFEEMKKILPKVIEENPDGMKGARPASPDKPFTSFVYAMSAAFSPNLNNPPFFVDLPFEYPSGKIIESVWKRWLKHDPATLLAAYKSDLMGMSGIYIDVGDKDELGLTPVVLAFHQLLRSFGISHRFELFEGGHEDKIVERTTKMLSFLSNCLASPTTVTVVLSKENLAFTWARLKVLGD